MVKSRKGFTLIELVVVIAILGILAGIAIPRFLDATATARGARIVADMRTVDSAIVIYNAKTGKFPTSKDALTSTAAATTGESATAAKYTLLAAWPVPPQGLAKISKNDGTTWDFTPTDAAYDLDSTNGRCTLDKNTVDDLLAGGKSAETPGGSGAEGE